MGYHFHLCGGIHKTLPLHSTLYLSPVCNPFKKAFSTSTEALASNIYKLLLHLPVAAYVGLLVAANSYLNNSSSSYFMNRPIYVGSSTFYSTVNVSLLWVLSCDMLYKNREILRCPSI